MSRALPVLLALLACAAAGCAGDSSSGPRWTEREAESIATVRSVPVRRVECEGLGAAEIDGPQRSYLRFDCIGGARAEWETYDTIAVLYVLRPLEDYEGPQSRHRVTRVRFVGGPGIP
jgi:hypothetical protein